MTDIKVICFPFAGGNIYSFEPFKKFLPSNFLLNTIEYPGRGLRIKEELIRNMEKLVDDLFEQFIGLTRQSQYVIYGHSMGSLVGYLIAKKAIKEGFSAPLALFLTGTSAIGITSESSSKYEMSDSDFIETLRSLGGSVDEIIGNSDFMEFYLPILRADFEAYERFEYNNMEKLNCPIYVIIGTNDSVSENQALLWSKYTSSDFEFSKLPGSHFFIFDHIQKILSYIQDKTQKAISNRLST